MEGQNDEEEEEDDDDDVLIDDDAREASLTRIGFNQRCGKEEFNRKKRKKKRKKERVWRHTRRSTQGLNCLWTTLCWPFANFLVQLVLQNAWRFQEVEKGCELCAPLGEALQSCKLGAPAASLERREPSRQYEVYRRAFIAEQEHY